MVKIKNVTTLSEMEVKVLYALTSSQGIWVFYPLSFVLFSTCLCVWLGLGGGWWGRAGGVGALDRMLADYIKEFNSQLFYFFNVRNINQSFKL